MSELDTHGIELALRDTLGRTQVGFGRGLSQEDGARLRPVTVDYPAFEKGIEFRDAEQDQEGNVTQESYGFEITENNRIQRVPGHILVEGWDERMVRAMHVHTSLDNEVELLVFDPPWIGVKSTGDTVFYDASLPDGYEWVGVPNIDKFLFTNGTVGIYQREFGDAGTVALVTDSPPAKTLANFGGRVVAGGVTIDGIYQALGIQISGDAEGLVWTGAFSSITFLIDNAATDDRIVAMRPMGFNLLAVICQKSIWVGNFTGDLYEPIIFEPRVKAVGCIAEPTCVLTPIGPMFLGESGVYVFDGNEARMVSGAINYELLPVLSNSIDSYAAMYEQVSARYWLFTPGVIWIYELKYDRWLKLPCTVHRGVAYSQQFGGVSWDSILATWDTVLGTWEDIAPSTGQEGVVLGYQTALGIPSRAWDFYMDGTVVEAVYSFARRDSADVNSMFTTQRIRMRYSGGGHTFQIWLPNIHGEMAEYATRTLPDAYGRQDAAEFGIMHTGKGAGLQLRWQNETLELSKVQQVGLFRSRKLGIG